MAQLMTTNIRIDLEVDDFCTSYDRLANVDHLLKRFRELLAKEKGMKVISVKGTIEEKKA